MQSALGGKEKEREKEKEVNPFRSEVRKAEMQGKEVNFNKKPKAPLDQGIMVSEENPFKVKSKVEMSEEDNPFRVKSKVEVSHDDKEKVNLANNKVEDWP